MLGDEATGVAVEFYGRYPGSVAQLAASYGVEHLVTMKGQVPYRESLRVQQEADALLLFPWTDPKERGVYSGKLFEYVGAGRPILAVGGGRTVACDLIIERGLGAVCDTAESVAAQLRGWLSVKRAGSQVEAPPASAGKGLTREDQTRRLDAFLRACVEQGARR